MTRTDRATAIGAGCGAAIAFVWAWLGFGAIVLIAVLAVVGGLIARLATSDTDQLRSSGGRR
ncbi:MAG: hypothetical protein ACXWBN_00335 [Acidimicrobiales bacterium]